jgi:hypothetical protein
VSTKSRYLSLTYALFHPPLSADINEDPKGTYFSNIWKQSAVGVNYTDFRARARACASLVLVDAVVFMSLKCTVSSPDLPVTTWLTWEREGTVIPVPGTFPYLAVNCLSQCDIQSHYQPAGTTVTAWKAAYRILRIYLHNPWQQVPVIFLSLIWGKV